MVGDLEDAGGGGGFEHPDRADGKEKRVSRAAPPLTQLNAYARASLRFRTPICHKPHEGAVVPQPTMP